MSGLKPLVKKTKNGKNRFYSREYYNESDDRFIFGIRLKEYKKKLKITDAGIQKALEKYFRDNAKNEKEYKELCEGKKDKNGKKKSIIPTSQYINNWCNNQDIPANASIIIALGKILKKDGYGLDYLFGITENDAPDMSMEYVSKYTGLSYDAIEHLKELSGKHPHVLNDFLTSEFFDNIIVNTQTGRNLKYDVKNMERDAKWSIFDYVNWYGESLEHQKSNKNYIKSEIVKNSRSKKIHDIASKIENLSDERLNQDSMPAYKLLQIKATVRAKLEEYLLKMIPALKSEKHQELLKIYNEDIKPIDKTSEYTDEYYNNVLVPLQTSIADSFDNSTNIDLFEYLGDMYGYDNISIGKPENKE